jgi:hypothetical protein
MEFSTGNLFKKLMMDSKCEPRKVLEVEEADVIRIVTGAEYASNDFGHVSDNDQVIVEATDDRSDVKNGLGLALEPGFLAHFANQSVRWMFMGLDKSSGQSPHAPTGLNCALDKENTAFVLNNCHNSRKRIQEHDTSAIDADRPLAAFLHPKFENTSAVRAILEKSFHWPPLTSL